MSEADYSTLLLLVSMAAFLVIGLVELASTLGKLRRSRASIPRNVARLARAGKRGVYSS